MWVALSTAFFAPFPLMMFFISVWTAVRSFRKREWARSAFFAALAIGVVRLRYIVRLLRRHDDDPPGLLPPNEEEWVMTRNGLKLNVKSYGNPKNPTIVLAHGWSLTQQSWFYQVRKLQGDFHVVTWDMRGNGLSEAPADGDYTCKALLDDFEDVIDFLVHKFDIRHMVLAGHSMGGMLLPLLDERCGKSMVHVQGLAMISATDRPLLETMSGRRWLQPLRKPLFEPLAKLIIKVPEATEVAARALWQMGSVHMALMFGLHMGRETRQQNDFVASLCSHFNMTAAASGALTAFDFDARRQLEQADCPVLLVTGQCDRNMPASIQQDMAARSKSADLRIVPDCGHLCIIECHHSTNEILIEFVEKCFQAEHLQGI